MMMNRTANNITLKKKFKEQYKLKQVWESNTNKNENKWKENITSSYVICFKKLEGRWIIILNPHTRPYFKRQMLHYS